MPQGGIDNALLPWSQRTVRYPFRIRLQPINIDYLPATIDDL